MTKDSELRGSCLCGSVRFVARPADHKVGACHCHMCRKWGGGPFMEIDCGSDVSFENTEHIKVFNSSEWAERGFCGTCGSHLFYRLKETQQHMMPVGLFEDTPDLVFELQVFIDEKPPYYSFAEKTSTMTGAEIFAMFGAESE